MTSFVIPFTVGRMGNFLFQAAAAIGYAKRHGLEFTVPKVPNLPRLDPVYLPHLVHPDYSPNSFIAVEEEVFHYHEIPFKEEWREHTIVLHGYWQSEKYFQEFREEILKLFAFPWECCKGYVSVHVRRGDYLRWRKKHPPVGKDWYSRAMEQFKGSHFRFFSDDIPWCQQNFGHREDCSFSVGQNEVEDLIRGSQCEHHICSASTFSWWQAWLNTNPAKRIIIPRLWFVPGWNNANTKDVVPESWVKLV